MRKTLHLFLKISLMIFLCVILGSILLTLVYCIPIQKIQRNVNESMEIFEEEKTYPELSKWCTSTLDNYTDSIMLMSASYSGDEDPFNKALMVYRLEQEDSLQVVNYPTYWHGYLIVLKPLLVFMDYGEIRVLNLVIQTLINIAIIGLMFKKNLKQYILPYILSVCMIMPIATAFSMQFADIFYIFSIANIVLLCSKEKWNNKDTYCIFFAAIGMATSYFDLLTYPLLTFGIPMILYMCTNDTENLRENLKDMFKYIFCWGFGYAGMWAGKWFLATLFTDVNVIGDAILSFLFRTSSETAMGKFSIIMVFAKNVYRFIKTPVTIIVGIFVLKRIFDIIKNRIRIDKSTLIQFVVVCLLPFGWYIFASNHSYIHSFFTNKILMIVVFAIMCFLTKTVSRKE